MTNPRFEVTLTFFQSVHKITHPRMASFPFPNGIRLLGRRRLVISTSAAPICHFDERSANLSFRRAQRQLVISTSAAPICHFDERSEEKSSPQQASRRA